MKGVITRIEDNGVQTTGKLRIFNDNGDKCFECYTLELPWKNNERRKSCIPAGEYNLSKYSSAKYKNVYQVDSVPNRSYILIHSGNFYTDVLGCILVGNGLKDINNDGNNDVIGSRKTLDNLKKATGYREFSLIVQEVF